MADDRMTVQFDVILPADITALAKLAHELERAFKLHGKQSQPLPQRKAGTRDQS
jgi:hypothetical protein